jgi:cytochrome c oxidase accessory protein FixG
VSLVDIAADDDGPLYAPAKKVYPQRVTGAFRRLKWRLLWFCLGVYYLLPFVRWDRGSNLPHQAVLADLEHSRFYFFFIELWPQEVYHFTGLLILAALALFLSNALFGRVWCGYFCPQTIWTDLFLWVERFVEGDRRDRIKLDAAPWTAAKITKRAAKHAIWLMIAWWTGGAWVLYFADAPTLVRDLATLQAPATAYIWIGILTFTTYALAGHMREQVCLYMCPWPRIQAALTDPDALNITYRTDRGEPRMSLKDSNKARAAQSPAGDCIDCFQCVAVCPTGVDIREGAQLGCIQCGLCIDACDSVMTKINRPLRLIAYDTDENTQRRKAGKAIVFRLVRSRTLLYAGLLVLVGAVMIYQLTTRARFAMSVLHENAPMFVMLRDGSIRNAYTLRFSNKWGVPRSFNVEFSGLDGSIAASVDAAAAPDGRLSITVGPDSTREMRVFVSAPHASAPNRSAPVFIKATDSENGETARAEDHFFAP